jgi:hypothetical protein
MAQKPQGSAAPNPPGTHPGELVRPSLHLIPNWEASYGDRNAYRVRGLSWFRANVQRDIDKLKRHLDRMEEERSQRVGWNISNLPWEDRLSVTQAYAARQGKALKFVKAAKVLLLCEIAAADKGIPPSVLYGHMRIEPALFGIADFSRDLLQEACDQSENLLATLRSGAAQTTERVFWDMAEGKAVSYRLAWRTLELLRAAQISGITWGHVIILPDRKKPKLEVTGREDIEAASVPIGAPDIFDPSPASV